MDEKLHKKAYDESRKSSPHLFNPNFDKHMDKVVKRDNDRARAAQRDRKISMA